MKLALTGDPDDGAICAVVAFFALVIRYARAWLFANYESLYKSSFILWNIVVGTPSDDNVDNRYSELIQRIGKAAWAAAGKRGAITRGMIEECLALPLSDLDVEVSSCSEIAAQMYAFVSSESFDPHGNNIFMMVDVGAGTLDSSVFYVSRSEDESWRFVTFSSSVEFNGSVNLHRYRLAWLSDAVSAQYSGRVDLVASIAEAVNKSDCLVRIPDSINDYISNMKIDFSADNQQPDNRFRESRVATQVYEVYQKARSEGGVPKHQLIDLPTFYCGGGMRMPFYRAIPTLFNKKTANYSWIRPVPRKLVKPEKLVAPGLHESDYDRLSVAYGLALMRRGEFVTVNKVSHPEVPEIAVPSDYILYPK